MELHSVHREQWKGQVDEQSLEEEEDREEITSAMIKDIYAK